MIIRNSTEHDVKSLFESALTEHDHNGLVVEIKYCRKGAKRPITGTYYRYCRSAPKGRLIRLRINRENNYPITLPFKTSEYVEKLDKYGRVIAKHQRLKCVPFNSAEHMLLGVFLHEFSHYLDHVQGLNGRYKQTKADKFAVAGLARLGILHAATDGK